MTGERPRNAREYEQQVRAQRIADAERDLADRRRVLRRLRDLVWDLLRFGPARGLQARLDDHDAAMWLLSQRDPTEEDLVSLSEAGAAAMKALDKKTLAYWIRRQAGREADAAAQEEARKASEESEHGEPGPEETEDAAPQKGEDR